MSRQVIESSSLGITIVYKPTMPVKFVTFVQTCVSQLKQLDGNDEIDTLSVLLCLFFTAPYFNWSFSSHFGRKCLYVLILFWQQSLTYKKFKEIKVAPPPITGVWRFYWHCKMSDIMFTAMKI